MPGTRTRPPPPEGADVGYPLLVVEDDADVRDLLRRMLEPEGYTVVAAEDGRAALARLRDVSPSLMPEMDGFEFVAELRRHEG
jgi:CheY-like chemotaxis protein